MDAVSRFHTQAGWSRFRPDSAELKLAHSFGLRERTFSEVFLQPCFGWNAWTIETFRGNDLEGEYRPSQVKDSVPWFPAAQSEDGETFKANQALRRCSQVFLPKATSMLTSLRNIATEPNTEYCIFRFKSIWNIGLRNMEKSKLIEYYFCILWHISKEISRCNIALPQYKCVNMLPWWKTWFWGEI